MPPNRSATGRKTRANQLSKSGTIKATPPRVAPAATKPNKGERPEIAGKHKTPAPNKQTTPAANKRGAQFSNNVCNDEPDKAARGVVEAASDAAGIAAKTLMIVPANSETGNSQSGMNKFARLDRQIQLRHRRGDRAQRPFGEQHAYSESDERAEKSDDRTLHPETAA